MNATAPAMPANSDPQPRVPLDIQLAIVDACPDVRTRLMLISTHKTLRKRGARLTLELPTAKVSLRYRSTAQSFFAFCAAQGLPSEPFSPLTILHTLDISLASVNPANFGSLIALLANVPKLTSLALRQANKALCGQPSLYGALRRLRTLKVLLVQKARARTFKLVSEIASALENVTIEPDHLIATEESLNLNRVLGPHKDTLTHVKIKCANVLRRMSGLQDQHPVVFEEVQELVVPLCVYQGASYFAYAFPNVRSLQVGTNKTPMLTKWTKPMDFLHYGNMSGVEHEHSDFECLDDHCWTLQTVSGGMLDLYVFGNRCSTFVLQIDGLIESDWAGVPALNYSHRPFILRLSVTPSLCLHTWERERRTMNAVHILMLQFVVDDQVDLKGLTDTAIRAVGTFVTCMCVFLDFKATNKAARRRLRGLDHLSLRRIVEDRQSGPIIVVVRSPAKTTYWRHHRCDGNKESQFEVLHMPAKTNFQTFHCFPKDHVTDDWV